MPNSEGLRVAYRITSELHAGALPLRLSVVLVDGLAEGIAPFDLPSPQPASPQALVKIIPNLANAGIQGLSLVLGGKSQHFEVHKPTEASPDGHILWVG